MAARLWFVRGVLREVLTDAPPPPATWPSVARRVIVVLAFFAVGVAVGDLSTLVLACFGAVQIGLMEAALPFRQLVRLLVPLVLACTAAVGVAMLIGGTWVTIPALAALSYVFGCTAFQSARAMSIGISALALAVIFSGLGRPPDQIPPALAWVVLGMVTQAAFMLLLWSPERRWFVRRAIANKLRSDIRLLREGSVSPESLVRVHSQGDVVAETLRDAGFTPDLDRRFREAASASIIVTRAIIAWMVFDRPGDEDRMHAGLRLGEQARRLDGLLVSRLAARRSRGLADGAQPVSPGPGAAELELSMTAVTESGDALTGGRPADVPIVGAARPDRAPESKAAPSAWSALRPGGPMSRNGVRMAIGVGVAQAISLLAPQAHSFWLPLTVVFLLRPGWGLTVSRSVSRITGNIAAVFLLSVVLTWSGGPVWVTLTALLVLASVTYRWFFGNYAIASFGLAGTILVLDYANDPDPSLFVSRFLATILGSVLAILMMFAIPAWSSTIAPRQVRQLVEALARWRADMSRAARVNGTDDDVTLEDDLLEARRCLLALQPTVTGVLLEPGDRGQPVPLALLFSSASREVAARMAITYGVLCRGRGHSVDDWQRMEAVARVQDVTREFDQAVAGYRQAVGDASLSHRPRSPGSAR
ncbi:MAG: FUSC family protein [bacterium]